MDALMLSMMAWLQFHTGYETEVTLPNVATVEVANLCQNYGLTEVSNCEAMQLKGFYNESHTIFLYGGFSDDNLADQSRLLHEMVHYIQWHNDQHVDGCWGMLEAEAYRLQDQWRLQNDLEAQADPFKLVMLEAACDS